MATRNDFFEALERIRKIAEETDLPEIATVQSIRKVKEAFPFAESTNVFELRAGSTVSYLVTQQSFLVNDNFEVNTTSWIEDIDDLASANPSSSQTNTAAFAQFASAGSLVETFGGATSTGSVNRYQALTTVAGDTWSVETFLLPTLLGGSANAQLRISWHSTSQEISSTSVTISSAGTTFQRVVLEGPIAPTSAVTMRTNLMLFAGAAGDSASVNWDLIRTERNRSTITARERRITIGEFVVRGGTT